MLSRKNMWKFWDNLTREAKHALRQREMATLRRDYELEFINSLPEAGLDACLSTGVLLSDEIERYATDYKLIDPFNPSKLKPAAYELSVGALYSIGGKTHALTDTGSVDEIVIRPFEVVIIQTLERVNLPRFLIARWNVRVRWAYKGLLWVGAAQVDPGFKGYLACPLYNLSDRPVRLHYGDEIAVIDFVTTTPPNEKSKQYDAAKRSRILFEDYEPNNLQSALATQAQEKIESFAEKIEDLENKVNTSLFVILTAIGILVAALTIFVTKQVPEPLALTSPALMLSAAAVIIALLAYVNVCARVRVIKWRAASWWWYAFQVLIIGLLIFIVVLLYKH
jgi:deoxycytidine triphosphate deaminase